jgi:GTPase SAR1 family protein
MNQVRIEYNPYKQEISYQWRAKGDPDWKQLSEENELACDKYQKTTLQSVADEILEKIVCTFGNNGKDPVRIIFRGTDEDYDDFKDTTNQYEKVLLEKDLAYKSAKDAAREIDAIFKSLEEKLRQDEDVADILCQYEDATSTTIPICVMGAYSSGKSMFINALIGEEILPSGSDPLTAQIFKVIPNTNYRVAFYNKNVELRFEILDQKVSLTNQEACIQCGDWIAEMTGISGDTNSEIMYHMIAKLNESGRPKSEDNESKLDPISGVITIEVPFIHSTLPTEKIHFEIYDTPGDGSASHKEHLEILKEALKERTNGLPILITTRDTLDSAGVEPMMAELQDSNMNLDRKNLMILINQADQETPKNLQNFRDSTPKTIITNQKRGAVMFLSSAVAVGCKKEMNESRWKDDKCRKAYKSSKKSFSDPKDEEDYLSLPKYALLPDSRSKLLCQQVEEAEKAAREGGNEDTIRELIAQNSGIRGVESEITYYAERFAAYNKCTKAAGYLEQAIQKVDDKKVIELRNKEKLEKALKDTRDKVRQDLCDQLKECKDRVVANAKDEAPNYLAEQDPEWEKLEEKAGQKAENIHEIYKKKKKKKKKKEREGWLPEAIRNTVSDLVKEYHKSINKVSVGYWRTVEQKLKNELTQIVNGNQEIPEEERKMLSEQIANYPTVQLTHIKINPNAGLVKRKFKLPFIDGKKFSEAQCKEDIMKQRNEICQEVTHTTCETHQEVFDAWSVGLLQKLTENLDHFNPSLRALNQSLCESKSRLEDLKREKGYLEEAGQKLQIY